MGRSTVAAVAASSTSLRIQQSTTTSLQPSPSKWHGWQPSTTISTPRCTILTRRGKTRQHAAPQQQSWGTSTDRTTTLLREPKPQPTLRRTRWLGLALSSSINPRSERTHTVSGGANRLLGELELATSYLFGKDDR